MSHIDHLEYLRRYNAWRTGEDDRTMVEAGISPGDLTRAINLAISEIERFRSFEIADAARVIEWASTPNRLPANTAFTAGPERQAAYWIEWVEGRRE